MFYNFFNIFKFASIILLKLYFLFCFIVKFN